MGANGVKQYKSDMLRRLRKAHQDETTALIALSTFTQGQGRAGASDESAEYAQKASAAIAGWAAEVEAQAQVQVALQLSFQTMPVTEWIATATDSLPRDALVAACLE